MTNKRGQGLSTNAIVLIILAVIVLILLVVGFTVGWSKFTPFLSGNNVDTVVTQCSIACSTDKGYDYCNFNRTLKADELDGGESIGSCEDFSGTGFEIYGIENCPAINCSNY